MILNNNHFYINLEKRTKKNKHCQKQLHSIGINNPNRFNAIENKIGLIGCAESHIKCIEIAKKNNWPFVCIFEDDVLFINNENINEKINKYINYNYDVLYIGAWLRNNKYEKIFDDLIKVNYTSCLHAYIVKKHYYDILLDNLKEGLQLKRKNPENCHYNNDEYIKKLQEKDNWLCLNPIMATQINGYSDNFNEIRNYEKIIPIIPYEMNPKISILTPTYNRKLFLPLMIYNIECFDYPKEKIEWIILDSYSKNNKKSSKLFNSEKEIQQLESKLKIKINYTYLEQKMEIGEKRNWLANKAKNDILINMDDDDIYLPTYILHSINTLYNNNKDCTGCLDMLFINTKDNYEHSYIKYVKNYDLLNEATLCMKKSHWEKYKYKESSKGEDSEIYGKTDNWCFTLVNKCMICVVWQGNTINKDKYTKHKVKLNIDTKHINILKNILYKIDKMESIDIKENNTVKNIEVTEELIRNVRNIIEVANGRIQWKTEELLPVGMIIKQLDDLLKKD